MDYERLIDAETWAFIRKTGESYADDAVELSIAEQRDVYDAMCRDFHVARPAIVQTEDLSADGVPVRHYWAGDPTRTVMYFHGGGLVVGGLESHDDICAEICAQTGYRVISTDYRLLPEHKHPASFDDAWTSTQWAANQFNDGLVLVGDSAGGNLAAAVAHHARGRLSEVLGQVLIYPGLGGDLESGSYHQHAQAPMLTRDEYLYYQQLRFDGPVPENDPTCAPLRDSDFSGLPPTVLISADCDPVRDDSRQYCEKLLAAGGRAHWINEPGLIHGFLRARHTVGRARNSFERISAAIEALGQKIWSYD
ncbi:alpha/beta hydrolase [Parasedimentitalea huanghaiensis]|uniref:Alpha/beta hydrolase fold domain-containing protein n=1 Tax=Parasedimentitalea huanghaiensis TaxID=2682100 RepID=A0A6L6WI96_9RHOB|nr:alpha/beta hydrolase [Zongyanglinia huanghaiensis]MVO17041.1 alpha/beta hydrolase fold domain-containing protein [Zongyanglinia huanghaiensis]